MLRVLHKECVIGRCKSSLSKIRSYQTQQSEDIPEMNEVPPATFNYVFGFQKKDIGSYEEHFPKNNILKKEHFIEPQEIRNPFINPSYNDIIISTLDKDKKFLSGIPLDAQYIQDDKVVDLRGSVRFTNASAIPKYVNAFNNCSTLLQRLEYNNIYNLSALGKEHIPMIEELKADNEGKIISKEVLDKLFLQITSETETYSNMAARSSVDSLVIQLLMHEVNTVEELSVITNCLKSYYETTLTPQQLKLIFTGLIVTAQRIGITCTKIIHEQESLIADNHQLVFSDIEPQFINILAEVYIKNGDLTDAKRVLKYLVERGVCPEVETMASFVAQVHNTKGQTAVLFLAEFKDVFSVNMNLSLIQSFMKLVSHEEELVGLLYIIETLPNSNELLESSQGEILKCLDSLQDPDSDFLSKSSKISLLLERFHSRNADFELDTDVVSKLYAKYGNYSRLTQMLESTKITDHFAQQILKLIPAFTNDSHIPGFDLKARVHFIEYIKAYITTEETCRYLLEAISEESALQKEFENVGRPGLSSYLIALSRFNQDLFQITYKSKLNELELSEIRRVINNASANRDELIGIAIQELEGSKFISNSMIDKIRQPKTLEEENEYLVEI